MSRSRLRLLLVVAVAVASIALVGCSTTTGTAAAGVPGAPGGGPWRVDFRDTFGGSKLGRQWTTCYWWAVQGCTISSNGEAEWYLPSQVAISDGVLHLSAQPALSRHVARTFTHQSGMVSTGRTGDAVSDSARYAFTYGHLEVRFRTPAARGLWPAIWMLPVTNQPLPEIDVLEQYGDNTRAASMTLHPTNGAVAHSDFTGPDLSQGWHTVALDWTPGRLQWTLDGRRRLEVTGSRVPSEPMYLIINLAVGGSAGSPVPGASLPPFQIDQVTVWKSA